MIEITGRGRGKEVLDGDDGGDDGGGKCVSFCGGEEENQKTEECWDGGDKCKQCLVMLGHVLVITRACLCRSDPIGTSEGEFWGI